MMIGMLIDSQTGDLLLREGTIAIGENTDQVAEHVLLAVRGDYKEFPLVGAEIHRLVNGTPGPMWKADAEDMLRFCGVPVSRIIMEEGQITIE